MKKILLTAATFGLLVACSNKDKTQEEIQKARQETLDSVNMANAQQRTMDSISAVSVPDAVVIENPTIAPEPTHPAPRTKTPKKPTSTPTNTSVATTPPTPNSTPAPSTGNTSTVDPGSTAGTGTPATAEEKKKKGLNNAAKGAIIGLGTGAAAGAIINKENRGKGAVIGGVIGAVGGAVGGAVIDKRKAKKEAEKDSTNKK